MVFLILFLFIEYLSAQVPDSICPAIEPHAQIIRHHGYTLDYAEPFEQAKWVEYHLTREHLVGEKAERGNNFRVDPAVHTGSADPKDYVHSHHDKGHLCPAADMAWSEATMSESFYMSNMSPQEPSFNRGIWKHLEEQVRKWAQNYGSLWIVTGPVLEKDLPVIGHENKVAVPEEYYKIIADLSPHHEKMIAFLMPNQGSHEALQRYVVTVDSVEKITGIDLFPVLNDSLENALESHSRTDHWSF